MLLQFRQLLDCKRHMTDCPSLILPKLLDVALITITLRIPKPAVYRLQKSDSFSCQPVVGELKGIRDLTFGSTVQNMSGPGPTDNLIRCPFKYLLVSRTKKGKQVLQISRVRDKRKMAEMQCIQSFISSPPHKLHLPILLKHFLFKESFSKLQTFRQPISVAAQTEKILKEFWIHILILIFILVENHYSVACAEEIGMKHED